MIDDEGEKLFVRPTAAYANACVRPCCRQQAGGVLLVGGWFSRPSLHSLDKLTCAS